MINKPLTVYEACKHQDSWIKFVQTAESLQDVFVGDTDHPATLFGTIPLPYSTLPNSRSK